MNHIGDVGAAALAEVLRSPSCALNRLDLRCNQVNATHRNAVVGTDVFCLGSVPALRDEEIIEKR